MSRQNRVDPYGRLIATAARGTMMGNRGLLHNDKEEIVRDYRGTRWICCELQFKGRKDPVMAPGLYTRLFFLDEATALAAGHRPCAECRRPAYNAFVAAWTHAHPGAWSATAIDEVLQPERLGARPSVQLNGLPDDCMIESAGRPHMVQGGSLLLWTPGGYTTRIDRPADQLVKLLTPISIVNTLRAGYVARCGVFSAPLL